MAVAVSGGRDSVALLHATCHAAGACGVRVMALHVHHGLQPQADLWQAHVEGLCRAWAAQGLPLGFAHTRLHSRPQAGDSVEAWARRERYRALAAMARDAGAPLVLLAQHRRDQAETFLLQALRGAGPAGLAAMPREVERFGLVWARPWRDQPREHVETYVRQFDLAFIDDGSNDDDRFARNRLRRHLMPLLNQHFGAAESALAQAAEQAAHAQQCLDEVASADLSALCDGAALRLQPWLSLPPGRRRNALRAWLQLRLGQGAAHTLVDRLMIELTRPGPARWPVGAQRELHQYRGLLRMAAASSAADADAAGVVALRLAEPGVHAAPGWAGTLRVTSVSNGGVALTQLQACELRPRSGAERFQRAPTSQPRSLKKQFQGAAVPAWLRQGPLVYAGDSLVFVPGLGIDARAVARAGEPQAMLEWLPDKGANGGC